MTELYRKPDEIEYHKKREISVFPPEDIVITAPDDNVDLNTVYEDIKAVINKGEAIVDDLAKVGEAFSIPIEPDEAQVRAAHIQLGGDGRTIKFQEYAAAIQEHQARRGDYLNEDFNGLGSGDMARIRERRWERHKSNNSEDKSLGVFDQLAKYGAGAVLLYLLNEQIGMFHAIDHSGVTSVKMPMETEVSEVLLQILQGLIMSKLIQGMTDEAIESYQNMDGIFPEGVDVKVVYEQLKNADVPRSDAFRFYSAQMASPNHETILTYSVRYCTRHISEGYESWLGYLTAQSVHEESLRSYYNGVEYRSGELSMAKAHNEVLSNKVEASDSLLDMVGAGLGRKMDWGETCCLLRFVDIYPPDILGIMKSIIEMSLSSLNWQCQQSFDWSLSLANHPYAVIHEKLIKMLDGLFDKVVGDLLDSMEIDSKTFQVLKACTPIEELMDFVLSAIVELKNWYQQMLKSIGIQIDKVFKNLSVGWQMVFKIRRANEIIAALEEIIAKAEDIGNLLNNDDALSGLVGQLEGATWAHDIPGVEALGDIAGFTEGALDWCRKIGDWDYISTQIGSLEVS